MKRILRFGWSMMFVFAMAMSGNSQVVFSEDFDNIAGTIVGGPGTYSFPAGWFRRDVDNLTPASAVSYINEAWERRENFGFDESDTCAFSTSWYSPAGTSNDFMWTPAIGPLPAAAVLSWNGLAYDGAYPDGYEVRIMTIQPTGGTADSGNQFTNSTVLFSTAAEAAAWTNHRVNLNDYTGQTVYIGFRNNSNDKFVLAIDDILVKIDPDYDPSIIQVSALSDYTMIPLQQVQSMDMRAVVKNVGAKTLHNIAVKCDVYNAVGVLVLSDTGSMVDSLVSLDTLSMSAGTFMPAVADSFNFHYSVLSLETDQYTTNNYAYSNIVITDTIYAREKSPYTGILGIGAGVTGFMGNQFTITDTTELRSVSMFFKRGYDSTQVHAVIWNMASGLPSAIIASTDSVGYTGTGAQTLTIPMAGGPVTILPGEYVVAAVETDSTLQLATSTTYFTPGKSWVYWSTIPSGVWSNPESLTFSVVFAIRANLYHCPEIASSILTTDASCITCNDGMASVTASNGTSPYTYLWSTGSVTPADSSLLPGMISVIITDALGCSVSDTTVVGYTDGIEENMDESGITPNPGNGLYHVSLSGNAGSNASISVYTQEGQMVHSANIPEGYHGSWDLDITRLPSAVYILLYNDGQKITAHKIIKQ